MPHGRLTPLGTQLRSVLANISRESPNLHQRRAAASPSRHLTTSAPQHATRKLHQSSRAEAQAAVAVSVEDDGWTEQPSAEDGKRFRQHGWRRLKRRKRVDHLSEALRDTGRHVAAPKLVPGKLDLSHVSPRSRTPIKDLQARQKRHKDNFTPLPAESKELSLQRILASYIRHQAKAHDYLEAEWETRYKPSGMEADFLRYKGFTLDDVAACAAIATTVDSLAAAVLLSQRVASLGPESVPTFVYLNLLRRDYISAQALRILIHCVINLFETRARRLTHPGIDSQPVFLVVIRLLRHAREVWPQVMPGLGQFMLRHLQWQEEKHGPFSSRQIVSITYLLNKLMTLVSYSTALHPFKDNPYQEATIIPILRYMAEHKPPMQIDRQGYRAVIRIQLAQRKSPSEQQWAELKALSWPPWKHDRNAMDATIGLDYGITRAGETLARMREAGYRMLNWEKTAHVYTGWDIDKTPTIQMRALFQRPGSQLANIFADNFTPWAARIASTRTIQEAWACYLAWEDAKLPHDQNVYLAIFRKLSEEERRQRSGASHTPKYSWRKVWDLLPGDTPQVSPLPPSAHLYTYTRTLPPRVHDFYATLIARGVILENHCLSFLVGHAKSLEEGFERLRNSRPRYPEIERLLTLEPSWDLSKLPLPVFTAAVELYTRFARVSVPSIFPEQRQTKLEIDSRKPLMDDLLNPFNPMARAIELLRAYPVQYRPLWNSVLRGLSKEGNLKGFVGLVRSRKKSQASNQAVLAHDADLTGAINAYRAHRRVLALLREHNGHLDSVGFKTLCTTTENAITAAWTIVLENVGQNGGGVSEMYNRSGDWYSSAKSIIKRTSHSGRLKAEFRLLVGQEDLESSLVHLMRQPYLNKAASSTILPRLLTIPSPAILHAYIRALGWTADCNGLLETVQWMRDYRSELAERRGHDRLGENMMRKVIVAVRVFLERSWLPEQGEEEEEEEHVEGEGAAIRAALTRLRTAASPEIIDAVRHIVEDVEEWQGWASDEEVELYTADKRFERVK